MLQVVVVVVAEALDSTILIRLVGRLGMSVEVVAALVVPVR